MTSKNISYQIIFKLNKDIELQIGKLGRFTFPTGVYVYTGSARKNIDQRIRRHLRKNKKIHWHIDYLLVLNECTIQKIVKSDLDECTLNQSTHGEIIATGFGASDCGAGCISHLKLSIAVSIRDKFYLSGILSSSSFFTSSASSDNSLALSLALSYNS